MNINALVKQYFPTILDVQPFRSWFTMFTTVMQTAYNTLFTRITHTGQSASLEHFLNTQNGLPYSLPNRTALIATGTIIYITDGVTLPITYLFNNSEQQTPTHFYNQSENEPLFYLYNQSEYQGADFVVWVPSSLAVSQDVIRGQVELYRSAGKKYRIQIY